MQRRASKNKKYGGGRKGSGRRRKKKLANKIGPEDDMDILQKQYFQQVDEVEANNSNQASMEINNFNSIDQLQPNGPETLDPQAAGPADINNQTQMLGTLDLSAIENQLEPQSASPGRNTNQSNQNI